MRHPGPSLLLTTLLLGAFIFPAGADEPAPDESFSLGVLRANPQADRSPIDVVKPPTVIRKKDYALVMQSSPATIQVAEPFTIDLQLQTPDETGPLALEPGTQPALILLQRRGHCGLYAPISQTTDGTSLPSPLLLPYSGGYEAYVRFHPAGQREVIERIPVFVEGVAENGRDITAFPRPKESWKLMPQFTAEVNQRVGVERHTGPVAIYPSDEPAPWGALYLITDTPTSQLLPKADTPQPEVHWSATIVTVLVKLP